MKRSPLWFSALVTVFVFATPTYAQARRVAVLDFANTSKDPAIEWLGAAVAETVTTKLHAIRSLQLVERLQLYKVLQEQKLHLSDVVDPSRAVQIGKLLRAEQVVIGGYSAFGSLVRFTARFVDVATGAIVSTSQVDGVLDRGNPNGLFDAFDRLAQAAIDSLNMRVAIVQGVPHPVPVTPDKRIEPTPEERARLAKAPANSLEAQEAAGRGLVAYRQHRWAEAAREWERATALDSDYAEAWQALGSVLDSLGRWPQALRAQETAYRLYARLADESGQAGTLNNIGNVHNRQGRYAEALSYYERSLRLSEKLGDEPNQAQTLNNIGVVHASQERYVEALSYHERSLRLKEKLVDEPGQAVTLNNIGIVHASQGRYAEALNYFERSLRLSEKLGDEPNQAQTLNNIGVVHRGQGRFTEALSYYERSLRLSEKLGDEPGQAFALYNIGVVHRREWRYAEALSYHERSLRLREKLGDEPGQAKSLAGIGLVYSNQKRYVEALNFLDRALEIADRLGIAGRDEIRGLRDQIRSQAR